MADSVSNTEDMIDSRDIIARIEELQEQADRIAELRAQSEAAAGRSPAETGGAYELGLTDEEQDELTDLEAEFGDAEAEELRILKELADEAEGYSEDWLHGATLIRYDYFTEYVQD